MTPEEIAAAAAAKEAADKAEADAAAAAAAEAAKGKADEEPPGGASGDADKEGEGDEGDGNEPDPKDAELPDWARAKLTKANAGEANYRTKLREAEKRLEGAKTPDEVATIVADMKRERETAELSLLRENVALKHKLPDELAEVLIGTTREELDAHAAKLAKFAPADEGTPDLSGGLTPGDTSEIETDPRKLANRVTSRKQRR